MATKAKAIGNGHPDSIDAVQAGMTAAAVWRLQERAAGICADVQERHGVAELIAGGHWAALAWLVAELERGEERLT